MSQKQINALIPEAIKIAGEKLSDNGVSIAKQYNGYISAFGASVMQAGLLPTIAFYSNESSSSEKNRIVLLEAIAALLNDTKPGERLLDYVLRKQADSRTKHNVINAAIALKLAIRTYPKS
ncbi:MAG: type III-B CRISPR module-associated protein Cmr5 [Sulfuricurvum sp.]